MAQDQKDLPVQQDQPDQAPEQQDQQQEENQVVQQEQTPAADEESTSNKEEEETNLSAATTPRKKRRVKKAKPVNPDELMPKSSMWPIALALSLVVMLFGAVTLPFIMVIGMVLVLICIIGWALERR